MAGEKLRLPGTFLQTVDRLSDADRLIQQDLIGEVSSRTFRLDMDVMIDETPLKLEEISAAVASGQPKVSAPALLGFELEVTRPYTLQSAERRTSWFVGDY